MAASWIVALTTIAVVLTGAHGDRTIYLDQLGGDVVLNCTEDGGSVMYFEFWVLPTNTTVDVNFTNYYIKVQNGGAQLALHELSIANIGEYQCFATNTTYDKIMIEMARPSLTEYYKYNIIVGVCVTLGFAVLAIGVFLTYHFRWREDKNESSYTMEDPTLPRARVEYVNKSYDSEPVPLKSTVTESRM